MKKILIAFFLVGIASLGAALSESKKDSTPAVKEKNEKHDEHEDHDDHIDEKDSKEKHEDHSSEKHGDEDHEDGEKHEENSKVGKEKGIIEASEELGFILSPEAFSNFEIRTMKLSGAGPWALPSNARMLSQNEVNFFRIRNGYIKRIDFKALSSQGTSLKVTSKDLKEGDEIIIHGVGFVRIAELAAFGGAPEGHSH